MYADVHMYQETYTGRCNTLQWTHCNTLQHSAVCCNELPQVQGVCRYTYVSRNINRTLQHTATHCNEHTATHCNTLQCVAVCYNELPQVHWMYTDIHIYRETYTGRCNILQHTAMNTLQHTAIHCSVLQWVTTSALDVYGYTYVSRNIYRTLQHTATHCSVLQCVAMSYHKCTACKQKYICIAKHIQHVATHCNTAMNTLQHIAVCCSVLQCVAVWCNKLPQVHWMYAKVHMYRKK